ncbi:hypothetical protein [Streptomyces sp. NPDC014006]|uniref:hypothetical protein n=1 Tax=Streptomyces sp. NPDC014006 TaxID=3364870 RepID=UPI0036FF515F
MTTGATKRRARRAIAGSSPAGDDEIPTRAPSVSWQLSRRTHAKTEHAMENQPMQPSARHPRQSSTQQRLGAPRVPRTWYIAPTASLGLAFLCAGYAAAQWWEAVTDRVDAGVQNRLIHVVDAVVFLLKDAFGDGNNPPERHHHTVKAAPHHLDVGAPLVLAAVLAAVGLLSLACLAAMQRSRQGRRVLPWTAD